MQHIKGTPLSKKHFLILIFLLGGFAISLFFQISKLSFWEKEKAVFFNLPGESIFVIGKNGEKILIDTGEGIKTAERLLEIFPFWERNLDALFLTHFDSDHLGGAEKILDTFSVKVIFTSGAMKNTRLTQSFLERVEEKKIPFFPLDSQKDVRVGDLIFDTLSPQNPAFGKIDTKNEVMLSGRLFSYDFSLLLTGDMEKKTEKEILFSPQKIKSNVLKVAHHGSKTSSSEEFLSAGNFQNAILVTAEKNPFGHPHKEVLERLLKEDISFFQTGKTGEIVLLFPQNSFSFSSL